MFKHRVVPLLSQMQYPLTGLPPDNYFYQLVTEDNSGRKLYGGLVPFVIAGQLAVTVTDQPTNVNAPFSSVTFNGHFQFDSGVPVSRPGTYRSIQNQDLIVCGRRRTT